MRQALEKPWMKWLTGFIFAIIILAFVLFFGPQSQGFGPGAATWVARVNGAQINNTELAASYERYRRLSGNQARIDDSEYASMMRQQAFAVAGVELLAERARQAGIAVSDTELRCFLVNWHRGYSVAGERICAGFPVDYAERFRNYDIIWFTQADGSFTTDYTNQVRSSFNLAADEYERRKENELLARYYLASLAEGIEVAPSQITSTWQRRNTTANLEVIKLDPNAVDPITPSESRVATWAASNASAIQAHYDENTDAYAVPREISLRRIYVRRPSEDDPGYAAAQANYEAALARVTTGGEDFAAVATELTEIEREAEEGGDMGERTEETISSDIWAATLDMSAGEVTGVEQQYAWNIILLESVSEARTRPLDEVRTEIATALLTDELTAEASEALAERGNRILEIAAEGKTLAEAAEQEASEVTARRQEAATAAWDPATSEEAPTVEPTAALPVTTTNGFAVDRPSALVMSGMELPPGMEFPPDPADAVPNVGSSRELVSIAFSLTPEAPLHNELVDVEGTNVIVRLIERTDAPTEVPAEDAEAIRNELRQGAINGLVGDENQIAALVMGMPGELSPLVQQVVTTALEDGRIELRESFFVAEDADPVEEI